MRSELIVDVKPTSISTALLEDGRLMSLQREARDASYAVGNLYFAKVKKLMPGLNAAFFNVGYGKEAFLHYLDLGSQFKSYLAFLKQVKESGGKRQMLLSKFKLESDIDKQGSVTDVLQAGQELIVQISKEPISTKGPRLTCDLSFAGRYLVLIPFNDKISVSTKIKKSAERARLKQLIMSITPKNFGVIVRTVAEGKRVAELDAEMKTLLKRWNDTITKVQKAQKLPRLVFEETGRAVAMMRDLFNPTYKAIHVNDPDVYEDLRNYVSLIAPESTNIVKLYDGKLPIFDNFDVTKQLKSGFGKTVNYKHGA